MVHELIESKMKLAESQENSLIKSQLYRELSETHVLKQKEISRMQAEIHSLYDSISQISEERNALVLLVEDSPRAGLFQSLDTVEEEYHNLEHHYDQSTTDLWLAISSSWKKVKTSRKLKSLSRKGIPPQVRGQIWQKMIKNKLKLNQNLYNNLIARVRSQGKKTELPTELSKTLTDEQVQNLSEVLDCFYVKNI